MFTFITRVNRSKLMGGLHLTWPLFDSPESHTLTLQGYLPPSCLLSSCLFKSLASSCSMFTIKTGISHSFMFTFDVSLQITCSSCSMFTIKTGISPSFMFTFVVSLQITCIKLQHVHNKDRNISLLHVSFRRVSSNHLL